MATHTTKTQAAHNALREAILEGDLEPGERLVISHWAEKLDMSEVPVREALSRLETEGLIAIKPHAGAFVSEISRSDLYEVVSMRRELEALASLHAAPNVRESDLAELAEINARMQRAASENDPHTFAKMNKTFHLTLYRRCGMDRLRSMIADLWSVADRYHMRMVFSYAPERMHGACAEHEEIMEALRTESPERVRDLIYAHKTAALNAMLSQLDLKDEIPAESSGAE